MHVVTEGQIIGSFKGLAQDNVYEFDNGELWQQQDSVAEAGALERPRARIWQDRINFHLEVDGLRSKVAVRRVERRTT